LSLSPLGSHPLGADWTDHTKFVEEKAACGPFIASVYYCMQLDAAAVLAAVLAEGAVQNSSAAAAYRQDARWYRGLEGGARGMVNRQWYDAEEQRYGHDSNFTQVWCGMQSSTLSPSNFVWTLFHPRSPPLIHPYTHTRIPPPTHTHPYTLIHRYTHTPHPRTLIPSYPRTPMHHAALSLIPSYPHTLIPSCTIQLFRSYPRTLMPSYPHAPSSSFIPWPS
jgi:hypothetical protein